MLRTVLTDISLKLSAIEINSTLNNDNLINAISGMLLTAGSNMVFFTDEEKDGHIYFNDYKIVAANWDKITGLDALMYILKLEYAGVKIVKGQESYNHEFTIDLNEFIRLTKPEKLQTVQDFETGEFHKSHIINLNFIKGFLALKDNMIICLENLIPDAVPIEYLRSLMENDLDCKGLYCKVSQLQGRQAYYVMNFQDMIWIFHINKKVERTKIHEVLTNCLSKVVHHA